MDYGPLACASGLWTSIAHALGWGSEFHALIAIQRQVAVINFENHEGEGGVAQAAAGGGMVISKMPGACFVAAERLRRNQVVSQPLVPSVPGGRFGVMQHLGRIVIEIHIV